MLLGCCGTRQMTLNIAPLCVTLILCAALLDTVHCNDCALSHGVKNVNVTTCLTKVHKLQKSHDIAIYREVSQLDAVCSDVEEARLCLVRHGCDEENSETMVGEWKGIKDSFQYICHTGRHEFLSESACWGSDVADQKIKSCSDSMNAGFENSLSPEKCSKMNAYITCMKTAVAGDCNVKASKVITQFAIKQLKPAATQATCKIFEDDGDLDDDGISDAEQQGGAAPGFKPRLSLVIIFSVLLPVLLAILLNTC